MYSPSVVHSMVVLDITLTRFELLFHLVAERPHRRAFTHDFERNALADIALRSPILNQRRVRPGHHVDETRGDGEAGHVVFERSSRVSDIAQHNDRIAVDRYVADIGRLAAAVVDGAPAEDEIVRLWWRTGGKGGQNERGRQTESDR